MPAPLQAPTEIVDAAEGALAIAKPQPPAAKKQNGDGSGKKSMASVKKQGELKSLLVLMLKAQLRSEQRHRDTEGVVFANFLGPSSDPILTPASQQGSAYAALVKGTKGHDKGPPFTYIFLGLLGGITQTQNKIGARTMATLQAFSQELSAMSWQEVAEEILMCKISNTHDKEKKRLTLALAHHRTEERKALNLALAELGWDRKLGRAPPSHMERELQEFLDAMLKE